MATKFHHLNTTITDAGTRTVQATLPENVNVDINDNVTGQVTTTTKFDNLFATEVVSANRIAAGTIDASISISTGGYFKAGGATTTTTSFNYQGSSFTATSSNVSEISTDGATAGEVAAAATGIHTATTGTETIGVLGASKNNDTPISGVDGVGVMGTCDKGFGVFGTATTGYGVNGQATSGWGVLGAASSSGGKGLRGINTVNGYVGEIGTVSDAIYAVGPSRLFGTLTSGTHSPNGSSDDIGTTSSPWDRVYCNYITCNTSLIASSNVNFSGIPNSASGLSAGDVWRDASGFLKIV